MKNFWGWLACVGLFFLVLAILYVAIPFPKPRPIEVPKPIIVAKQPRVKVDNHEEIPIFAIEGNHTEKINKGDNVIVYLARPHIFGYRWHLKKEATCCVRLGSVTGESVMNQQGDFHDYTKFCFVGCSNGIIEFECYSDGLRNDTEHRRVLRTFVLNLEQAGE
jgi:hypothetical protein